MHQSCLAASCWLVFSALKAQLLDCPTVHLQNRLTVRYCLQNWLIVPYCHCSTPASSAPARAPAPSASPFVLHQVQQHQHQVQQQQYQQQHQLQFLANALQLQSQLSAQTQIRPNTSGAGTFSCHILSSGAETCFSAWAESAFLWDMSSRGTICLDHGLKVMCTACSCSCAPNLINIRRYACRQLRACATKLSDPSA